MAVIAVNTAKSLIITRTCKQSNIDSTADKLIKNSIEATVEHVEISLSYFVGEEPWIPEVLQPHGENKRADEEQTTEEEHVGLIGGCVAPRAYRHAARLHTLVAEHWSVMMAFLPVIRGGV